MVNIRDVVSNSSVVTWCDLPFPLALAELQHFINRLIIIIIIIIIINIINQDFWAQVFKFEPLSKFNGEFLLNSIWW